MKEKSEKKLNKSSEADTLESALLGVASFFTGIFGAIMGLYRPTGFFHAFREAALGCFITLICLVAIKIIVRIRLKRKIISMKIIAIIILTTFFALSLYFLSVLRHANVAGVMATPNTSGTATLSLSVTPYNSTTTAWFEYGTTTSLGYSSLSQTFAPSYSPSFYSYTLTNLPLNTTYYYRSAAVNAAGVKYGEIESFKEP